MCSTTGGWHSRQGSPWISSNVPKHVSQTSVSASSSKDEGVPSACTVVVSVVIVRDPWSVKEAIAVYGCMENKDKHWSVNLNG